MTITLLKKRVCGPSHTSDTRSNLATPQFSRCTGPVTTCLSWLVHDVYMEDSVDERHMWKLDRLLLLLEHRHLLVRHSGYVHYSINMLALMDLHRLSFCLDGWYLVLLRGWDIDDLVNVLDRWDWCLLHHCHIDNFVDELRMGDIDNLVNELHLRDFTAVSFESCESQAPGFATQRYVCKLLPSPL